MLYSGAMLPLGVASSEKYSRLLTEAPFSGTRRWYGPMRTVCATLQGLRMWQYHVHGSWLVLYYLWTSPKTTGSDTILPCVATKFWMEIITIWSMVHHPLPLITTGVSFRRLWKMGYNHKLIKRKMNRVWAE